MWNANVIDCSWPLSNSAYASIAVICKLFPDTIQVTDHFPSLSLQYCSLFVQFIMFTGICINSTVVIIIKPHKVIWVNSRMCCGGQHDLYCPGNGVGIIQVMLTWHSYMIMSWHGNAFHFIGPLCWESTITGDIFFGLSMNTILNKQLSYRCFKVPWNSCEIGRRTVNFFLIFYQFLN